jgi:hypothetical protein
MPRCYIIKTDVLLYVMTLNILSSSTVTSEFNSVHSQDRSRHTGCHITQQLTDART